ncbi:MAG: hypothetical protein WBD20_02085 [Pirellulaceae bacterium]
MNVTQTQRASETAFDGPLSPSMTIVLAVVLAMVFAWSLYRERFVLGSRTTLAFAALRLLSLAAILWMLLAPTRVVVETSTTKRTVAFVTDTSASMGTVDPPGTADAPRWLAASKNETSTDAVSSSDRAVGAMGIADRELAASIDAVKDHRSDDEIAKRITITQRAIERAMSNVESIRDLLPTDRPTGEAAAEFDPVLKNAWRLLSAPEFEEFAALEKRLASGRSPQKSDWRESLSDLQYRVRTTRQVLKEMSRILVETSSSSLAEAPQSSRLNQVATFLKALQKNTIAPLNQTCDIRWSQFNKNSETVNDLSTLQVSWKEDSQGGSEADRNRLSTNLTAALEPLRSSGNEIPFAAAFVFTDVAHNHIGVVGGDDETPSQIDAVAKPIEVARKLSDTPVYIVPIGNANRLRDVNLVGVDAPTVAMRNDDIVIEAHLEAYQCEGERCSVKLMAGAEVVDFREVEFDTDFASRTVRFQRRVSEIGETSLSVAIDPIDGEMTEANNLQKIAINVTRNQIKVLLADEMPRWEFRYLAQLFRRDSKVECDEMLFRPRLIATGDRAASRTFPTTADQWDQYDVVILGDLPPEHFPVAAQVSLAEYLNRRGGTLVLIAGQRAMPDAYQKTPLADLLPVTKIGTTAVPPSGYAFQATATGRSHVALMIGETQQATQTAWDFINRFSPLHDVSPWRRPKPSAKNLIAVVPRDVVPSETQQRSSSADADSFLCWQPIGRGRVVYLSGPDTYRLRFLRGDRYHYRFWGQMLRWAIASDLGSGFKMVRIRSDKTDYQLGQDVTFEVRLMTEDGTPVTNADDVMLQVTSGQVDQQVALVADADAPGLFRAIIASPNSGVYRAQPIGGFIDKLPAEEAIADLGISFTVQADLPLELADTRVNHVLASQISQLTGGQVLPPTAVAEVLALTDLSPIVTESVQQTPLWAQWKYLWLVFGCLQVEWIVRKWRGFS